MEVTAPTEAPTPKACMVTAGAAGLMRSGQQQTPPIEVHSRFIQVDGIRTHYLEAGKGLPLILLHSGEFGASAELSWEHNIAVLAERFHVYAPDWLGYGETQKLFCFEDMRGLRTRHIASFLRTLCIDRAAFMGNSMGGTMLLAAAAMAEPPWPIDRMVVVCGGGDIPENDARETLNSYDGSRDHMRRIVRTMFVNSDVREDEAYVDRRHRSSLARGAWECAAAVRFKAPGRRSGGMPKPPDYSGISRPLLLVTGAKDVLRKENFGPDLQAQIPGAELHVVQEAGHCPQIDAPEEFNRVVLNFLCGS
ncbi:alpha/beta fold hydrolase [Roseomonas chloroacetimidivorans]|uniref:alpha/beta fold hydrolase n=1 Tax=Roseomonas chloroacetimidivorans TaxID=1766656 RepID=UPI003C74C33D